MIINNVLESSHTKIRNQKLQKSHEYKSEHHLRWNVAQV